MQLPILRFSPSELLLDGYVHQHLAQGAAQHVKQSHPEPDLLSKQTIYRELSGDEKRERVTGTNYSYISRRGLCTRTL